MNGNLHISQHGLVLINIFVLPNQRFKLYISLNYAVIQKNVVFERVVVALQSVVVNWSNVMNVFGNLIG